MRMKAFGAKLSALAASRLADANGKLRLSSKPPPAAALALQEVAPRERRWQDDRNRGRKVVLVIMSSLLISLPIARLA